MVSTPVIIVVTVLLVALVIISALLIYKLRPGQAQDPRKASNAESESLSPVRRLTVMRGQVVSNRSSRRSILQRWSASVLSSRRNSAASFSSLHPEHEPKSLAALVTPGELEAQTFAGPQEKRALYRIEEHDQSSEHKPATRKQKKKHKSSEKPKAGPIPHDSLPFSSWQDYNGHRPVLDDLASPIAAFSSVAVSSKESTSASGKRREGGQAEGKAEKNDATEGGYQRVNSADKGLPEPPKPRGKRPQDTTVDVMVIKAASISAKPKSAYSSKPTPASSIESIMNRQHSRKKSGTSKPSSNVESTPVPEVSATDQNHRPESDEAKKNKDDGENPDSPTSPVPLSRYTTFRGRQSRASSRAGSRSRSRSCSTRNRSRSRSHRVRKARPPPIAVVPAKERSLPAVVRTAPSNEALQDQEFRSPSTPLTLADVESGGEPLPFGSPDTSALKRPPLISANITSLTSSGSSPARYAKSRQSINTIATSDYSPTFSLASVRRVPLYAGKQELHSQKREKAKNSTPNSGQDMPKVPRKPIPSVLQTANQSAPPNQWPLRPTRRQSIQAQDYSLILSPPKAAALTPPKVPIDDEPLEAYEYRDIVRSSLQTKNPFNKPSSPPAIQLSLISSPTSPPKTAYSILQPRERVISIPTGRRRNSRYSHLFEKALPTTPAAETSPLPGDGTVTMSELPGSERPTTLNSANNSRPLSRRIPSNNPPLPYPRDSRLWEAPALPETVVPDISPVGTPEKSMRTSPWVDTNVTVNVTEVEATDEKRVSGDVSPLTEDFPVEAAQAVGRMAA